ncbi:glycosyl transferase [Synergistales bacterium]|nr:glycosyl transferase [Synergistales bacterium]
MQQETVNMIESSPKAPIVLFVYNRPEHTRRTIKSLRANRLASASHLIVFSDGAKSEEGILLVEQVRQYIDEIDGFASVTVIKRDKNWGLANSIIDGVTQIVNKYGKIIVLEDDLLISPYFLDYMNDGLDLYEGNKEVATIQAHIFPWTKSSLPDSYFLPSAGCWGWGTWKRAWDNFNKDTKSLLDKINQKGLARKFDMDSSYPYTRMLKRQIRGEVDSWAIRWYATNFLLNMKGLYPGHTFIQQIGYDASGTHCGKIENIEMLVAPLAESYIKIKPVPVEIDPVVYGYMKTYYKQVFPQRNPFLEFILGIVRKVLPKKALNFIRTLRQSIRG